MLQATFCRINLQACSANLIAVIFSVPSEPKMIPQGDQSPLRPVRPIRIENATFDAKPSTKTSRTSGFLKNIIASTAVCAVHRTGGT